MGFLSYVLAIAVIYESQLTLRRILPPIKTILSFSTPKLSLLLVSNKDYNKRTSQTPTVKQRTVPTK